MKLKDKTIIKSLISLLIVFIFIGMFSIKVNAENVEIKYNANDYRYWNQKDSMYPDEHYRNGMHQYGCWVTAQAKLLYAIGIEKDSSIKEFNPDTYLEWEINNSCIDWYFNQTYQGGWNGPIKYAETKGKKLVCQNCNTTEEQIKTNVNLGYYTILKLWSSLRGSHYVLVDNVETVAKGIIYVDESGSDWPLESGKGNGPIPLANLGMEIQECYYYYAPLTLKVEINLNGKAKLSWNAIPGATKYTIARKRWEDYRRYNRNFL